MPTGSNRFSRMLSEGLGNFLRRLSTPGAYEDLFSLSDSQLAVRGFSRDGLTRSFIAGRSHN